MGMPDMTSLVPTMVPLDVARQARSLRRLLAGRAQVGEVLATLGEHMTLATTGMDDSAATAHLETNGVTMLSEELDYISRRLRLFEGPEGITLELVEWVDPNTAHG
jgi:hypothetical protein